MLENGLVGSYVESNRRTGAASHAASFVRVPARSLSLAYPFCQFNLEVVTHPREAMPESDHIAAPRSGDGGCSFEKDARDEPGELFEIRLVHAEPCHLLVPRRMPEAAAKLESS